VRTRYCCYGENCEFAAFQVSRQVAAVKTALRIIMSAIDGVWWKSHGILTILWPMRCTLRPSYTSDIFFSSTLARSTGLLVAGTLVMRTSIPFASKTSLIPRQ
jgi:hypothetical protein